MDFSHYPHYLTVNFLMGDCLHNHPFIKTIIRLSNLEPNCNTLQHQPLTAPSMIPFSKYLCINGYTQRIGITDTIEIVYLITFEFIAYSIAFLAVDESAPSINVPRFDDWFR